MVGARELQNIALAVEPIVLMFLLSSDNLTLGDVEPMLEALQGNLTSVNTSIILATDMMNGLRYLDEGFTQVSRFTPAYPADHDYCRF